MPHTRKYRGFTLIELLVVVAIIALLISILLPSLNKARETARTVACASSMKQMGMAHHMYADEYDGKFTPPQQPGLHAWIKNPDFRKMLGFESGPNTVPPNFICPSGPDEHVENGQWFRIWGMNYSGREPDGSALTIRESVHRPSLPNPSGVVQMADCNEWHINGTALAEYTARWDQFGDLSNREGGRNAIAYRHSEGANLLFFDGHVAHQSKQECSTPGISRAAEIQLWGPYAAVLQ